MEKTAAQEAVMAVGRFTNNMGRKQSEFITEMDREHRTLQQNFTGLALQWLKFVASPEYCTDGRNEYSQKIARKLLANVEEWELNCPFI